MFIECEEVSLSKWIQPEESISSLRGHLSYSAWSAITRAILGEALVGRRSMSTRIRLPEIRSHRPWSEEIRSLDSSTGQCDREVSLDWTDQTTDRVEYPVGNVPAELRREETECVELLRTSRGTSRTARSRSIVSRTSTSTRPCTSPTKSSKGSCWSRHRYREIRLSSSHKRPSMLV